MYWFSPTREWIKIEGENTKEFLLILRNVTKGYNG
jgi:hypothetical protein